MTEHQQPPNRWRNVWQAALTGAVYGFVTTGLASLLLPAFFLISRAPTEVYVFAFIAVPVITLAGTLPSACCGFVYALLRRGRSVPEDYTRSIGRLILWATLIMPSGAALILIGAVIWAVIANRPFARLESLGGDIDYHSATLSFPDGTLGDDDFPAVIECLNLVGSRDWYHLDLSNTRVSGSGLRYLQEISHPGYDLILSRDQLDDDGLNHLDGLTNIDSLSVDGNEAFAQQLESLGAQLDAGWRIVSFPGGTLSDDDLPALIDCLYDAEIRDKVQQAMPNARYIHYWDTDWLYLDLSNTRVSGSGLRHFQRISYGYYNLVLSSDQFDDEGLNHLGALTNIDTLSVHGHVDRETREQVRQALPNVRDIGYHEDQEQFESFGGSVDTANATVSFHGRSLSSNDLPAVIDRLNNVEWDWYQLNLAGTGVRGSGLRHLGGISHPRYILCLSSDQLDDEGLHHLGALTNIDTLWVGGDVPPETREKVRQALPNVRDIQYIEGPDFRWPSTN